MVNLMSNANHNRNEIVLYQPDSSLKLEVRVENETVWLNRHQIAQLFERDVKTIGKHINNALNEELSGFFVKATHGDDGMNENPVVAKFATTAADGKVYRVEYYNLDVVLSVGYRVKSQRGVQFRIWSNRILKDYLLKGYAVNQRFERIENRVAETEKKIDFFVRAALPPAQGVFFEGQIFDAYAFVADLVKSAKKSLVLLDNYVDESVLLLLAKRSPGVTAKIHTRKISQQIQLDLTKHNAQYAPVAITQSGKFHDRFLLVDDTTYHIGASLKDLGKKLFAFSIIEIKPTEILKGI